MPSFHAGWNVLLGIVVFQATRHLLLRALAVLGPASMVVVHRRPPGRQRPGAAAAAEALRVPLVEADVHLFAGRLEVRRPDERALAGHRFRGGGSSVATTASTMSVVVLFDLAAATLLLLAACATGAIPFAPRPRPPAGDRRHRGGGDRARRASPAATRVTAAAAVGRGPARWRDPAHTRALPPSRRRPPGGCVGVPDRRHLPPDGRVGLPASVPGAAVVMALRRFHPRAPHARRRRHAAGDGRLRAQRGGHGDRRPVVLDRHAGRRHRRQRPARRCWRRWSRSARSDPCPPCARACGWRALSLDPPMIRG